MQTSIALLQTLNANLTCGVKNLENHQMNHNNSGGSVNMIKHDQGTLNVESEFHIKIKVPWVWRKTTTRRGFLDWLIYEECVLDHKQMTWAHKVSCCYLIPRVYNFWVEWFTETGNIHWILSRLQCGTGWKNWRKSHLFTRIMLEVYMTNCNIKTRKQGSLWVCRRFLPVEYQSRQDKNKGDHHAKLEAFFKVFSEYQITVVFTKVWKRNLCIPTQV